MADAATVRARLGGLTDSGFGDAAGTYSASVASGGLAATASVSWTTTPSNTSYRFSGTAVGDAASDFAYSEGVVVFTLAAPSKVWITWNFANVAAASTSTSFPAAWSIAYSDGLSYLYGLGLEAGEPLPATTGGVPATTVGAGPTGFLGLIPAGTWIFSANVDVDATVIGEFNVQITLPGPGALPLIAVASLVARRGRRR